MDELRGHNAKIWLVRTWPGVASVLARERRSSDEAENEGRVMAGAGDSSHEEGTDMEQRSRRL